MKPLNSYVLLEVEDETEQKTVGGLYVPPTSTRTPSNSLKIGHVVEVSEKAAEFGVETGQDVYYDTFAIKVIPDDNTHVLVRCEDLYSIV